MIFIIEDLQDMGHPVYLDTNLRRVGVRPAIGHRQDARAGVLQCEILVVESLAINRLATGAIAGSEIAALQRKTIDKMAEDLAKKKMTSSCLNHKLGYYSMNGAAFVAKTLFTGA